MGLECLVYDQGETEVWGWAAWRQWPEDDAVVEPPGWSRGWFPTRTQTALTIYIRLRELRLALGLTQAELAARARVRRATVSRLENSRVSAIDLHVLERLADLLGVEPGFLLSRTPPPRSAPSSLPGPDTGSSTGQPTRVSEVRR